MSTRTASRSIMLWMLILLKSSKIMAVLKTLKFTKPLVTLLSMLVSALAYGWWLGPWFGVGLVAIIFLHEMGHVIALRWRGFETSGPVFIPFLGAAIFVPAFTDRTDESVVAIGGPLIGLAGVGICFAGWWATDSEILILLAWLGVVLNLFNLIPLSPLDGGRVTQIVGKWFKYVGAALLLLVTIVLASPALLLIWILCVDAIDTIPPRWRTALCATLGLAMAALMLLGYSDQPSAIDVADCVLAGVVTGGAAFRWHRFSKGKLPETQSDDRAYPGEAARLRWLVGYLALSGALIGGLVSLVPLLPKGVSG